jgi:hypothetical protein
MTDPWNGSAHVSIRRRSSVGCRGEGRHQRQIDVYGEVLGAAAQLSEHIDTIDEDTRRFANDLGLLAEEVNADAGELLGDFPRHSATSAWSTPRGRSPKPSGEPGPDHT